MFQTTREHLFCRRLDQRCLNHNQALRHRQALSRCLEERLEPVPLSTDLPDLHTSRPQMLPRHSARTDWPVPSGSTPAAVRLLPTRNRDRRVCRVPRPAVKRPHAGGVRHLSDRRPEQTALRAQNFEAATPFRPPRRAHCRQTGRLPV